MEKIDKQLIPISIFFFIFSSWRKQSKNFVKLISAATACQQHIWFGFAWVLFVKTVDTCFWRPLKSPTIRHVNCCPGYQIALKRCKMNSYSFGIKMKTFTSYTIEYASECRGINGNFKSEGSIEQYPLKTRKKSSKFI